MISIGMTDTGARTVTPRAVGLCASGRVDQAVLTTAERGFAVAGVPVRLPSSTPGDLPPEDPLS